MKSVRPEDLASAIRQCFVHSVFFAPAPAGLRDVSSTARDDPRRPKAVPALEDAVQALADNGVHPLTRREREILTLVSEGLQNADIAQQLWITEQTVKFHLTNIYRKLGVSNRTQASRWAIVHVRAVAGQPSGSDASESEG